MTITSTFRRFSLTAAVILTVIQAGIGAEERFKTSGGDVVVQPLAHASVRVDYRGTVIYVDPWARADLTAAAPADLIVITDADAGAHHLDPAAILRLKKASTVVVTPASGRAKLPDAVVMANGEHRSVGDVEIEALAAYDIKPGAPFHEKGVANGYLVTIGGMRLLFAGVTECVPEISRLRNIDVAFVPMNLPNDRMTVEAAAACLTTIGPKVAYPYHYDQDYIARLSGRGRQGGAEQAERSVRDLAARLSGRVEVRSANWYPVK